LTDDENSEDPRVLACLDRWVGGIDWLYRAAVENPDNEDWNVLVAACLVRNGLAPKGFTGDDLAKLERQRSTEVSVTAGEEPVILSEPANTNPPIPGTGVLLDSVETGSCMTDPIRS